MVLALILPLACGEARPQSPPEPAFWVKVKASARGAGPFTYITREPLELADGSQVVCVATLDALWCKDAK